jgi:hypothetical protein
VDEPSSEHEWGNAVVRVSSERGVWTSSLAERRDPRPEMGPVAVRKRKA